MRRNVVKGKRKEAAGHCSLSDCKHRSANQGFRA